MTRPDDQLDSQPNGPPELAVVLAGGTGRRLGGVDKGGLVVGGRTLLERALAVTVGIEHVVVVGPRPETFEPGRADVHWTREDPPSGGPAAGVLAGLAVLDGVASPSYDALVLVLAVDMPRVTDQTVLRLARAAREDVGADGAVLVDHRVQHLSGVYRIAALREAAPATSTTGLPMHRLVGGLRLVEVAAVAGEGEDLDTWSDVRRATDL